MYCMGAEIRLAVATGSIWVLVSRPIVVTLDGAQTVRTGLSTRVPTISESTVTTRTPH